MLENTLFESQGRRKTRKPATVVVSAIVHVAAVAVLVLIPLLQTQAIVIPPVDMSLSMPRTERTESIDVFSQPSQGRRQQPDESTIFTPPQAIPERITYDVEPPMNTQLPFTVSSAGRNLTFVLGSLGNGPIDVADLRPPAPPPPPVVHSRPVRQGGDVQAADLIYQVKPAYPVPARTARVQGIVVLEAVIAKDGSVDSLRVISGNPLLTPAALEAVRQWKYRPTMLNREPVDVITTITVTFTLQ